MTFSRACLSDSTQSLPFFQTKVKFVSVSHFQMQTTGVSAHFDTRLEETLGLVHGDS